MPPVVLSFGPFRLDESNARLQRDGIDIDLVPKAFGVLCHLAARPGQLVSKDELLDAVWGRRFVSESVLKSAINAIRRALGDAAQAPRFIETVSRRGYRFIAQLPVPAPGVAQADVIGREEPLAWLQQRWQQACAGQRRVVMIAGEPGVGKTTLVDRFVSDCASAMVGRGQCVEQVGAATPFLPLLDAIDALSRRDATLAALLRQVAPTCLAQLPWHVAAADRDALLRETQAAAPDRMLREVSELFDRIAQKTPLLVVLEDMHWSDPVSVQWLDHHARRRSAAGVMVLATFRPTEVILREHPLADLRREFHLHDLCEELALEGWDETTIADYLGARMPGQRIGATVVAAVRAHTDGLPLFVRSLADEMQRTGRLTTNGPASPAPQTAAWPVPLRLAAVIELQVRRLQGDVRKALEVASLCTDGFSAELVAQVLDADVATVANDFDGLVQRGLWVRVQPASPSARAATSRSYGFLHAVYRHALASLVDARRREQWHRRIAQAIEARCAGQPAALEAAATELAFHAECGAEFASAAAYCAMAASNAMRRTAPRLALAITQRGLDLLAGSNSRHDEEVEIALLSRKLLACVATQGYAGEQTMATARRALAIVQTWPLHAATLPVWYGCFWTEVYAGHFQRCAAVAEQLEQRIEEGSGPLADALRLNMAGVRAYHADRLADAEACFSQALARFDSVSDFDERGFFPQSPRLEAVAHLAQVQELRGRFDAAARHRERLMQMIDSADHPLAELMGLWFLAYAHMMRREVDAARTLCERAIERMAGHAANPGLGMHQTLLGWCLAQGGEPERGARLALDGRDAQQRVGAMMGHAAMRSCVAAALATAQDLALAHDEAMAAVAAAADADNCFALSDALRVLGEVQWQQTQDSQAAEPVLQRAVAVARQCGAVLLEVHACDGLSTLLDATDRVGDAAALMHDVLARMDSAAGAPALSAIRSRQAQRQVH